MLRRRIWVIAGVTLLGCVVSFSLALSRSHLYQSAEVLQVTQPKVDDNLASSTAGHASARQLQLVQQQLMARKTILDVAAQYNLYPGRLPSEKVVLLREAVTIEGIAAAREGFGDDGMVSVLRISATMGSPREAQQLAHEFAQRTITLHTKARLAKARETLEFFELEEAKLTAELETLENELTAFRRANDLTISGNLEFRQSQYASINAALLDIEREKITLQRELSQVDQNQRAATIERVTREIEAEIATLEAQRVLLEERAENLNSKIETTPRIERELGNFDRRRETLQDQIDVVSARRAEAEVGLKLEEQSQTSRLRVIEPATLPDFPVTSSRRKTAIMGGVISVFAGIGLAFLLDLRRPVIRNSRQMQARVGLIPVVTIPEVKIKKRRAGFVARIRQAYRRHLESSRDNKVQNGHH